MVYLASRFKDQARYLAAAARFRLPYWDYFKPRSRVSGKGGADGWSYEVPWIFSTPTVQVRFPDPNKEGDLVKVQNPLYTFAYPKVAASTLRWDILDTNSVRPPDLGKDSSLTFSRKVGRRSPGSVQLDGLHCHLINRSQRP